MSEFRISSRMGSTCKYSAEETTSGKTGSPLAINFDKHVFIIKYKYIV